MCISALRPSRLAASALPSISLPTINLQNLPLSESAIPSISLPNLQDLLSLILPAAAPTIEATEASLHLGQRTTVCGRIASERIATRSRGTPTFINLDKPYPDRMFTVRILKSDRASVGAIPSSGMLCATGVIASYRGKPEIAVKDAQSWYVPR